jgi:hypothetical protein
LLWFFILQNHNNENNIILVQKQAGIPMAQNRRHGHKLMYLPPTDLQQRSPKHTMEKKQPVQQMLLGKLNIHMYITEIRSLSFTLHQNQLKVDQRAYYKA